MIFNWTNYFFWVIQGIFHAILVFVIPMFCF